MDSVDRICEIISEIETRVKSTRTAYDAARAEYRAAVAALKPARKREKKSSSGPSQVKNGPSAGRWRIPGSRLSWPTRENAEQAMAEAVAAAAAAE